MDDVDAEDMTSALISIERCRELLGDEADDLSDEEVLAIGRHADTMARVVIDLFFENRSRVQ